MAVSAPATRAVLFSKIDCEYLAPPPPSGGGGGGEEEEEEEERASL